MDQTFLPPDRNKQAGILLRDIEEVIKEWNEILETRKNEKQNLTSAEWVFISFKLKETEEKWTSISKSANLKYPDLRIGQQVLQAKHNKPVFDVQKEQRLNEMQVPFLKGAIYDAEEQNRAVKELKQQNTYLEEKIADLGRQIAELKDHNTFLQTRLSKMASDALTKDNPNIADLSDPNRPTKLAEVYSELYDNEYTEALSSLMNNGYDERQSVDTLLKTLLDTYQFCSFKSEGLLQKTEEVFMHLLDFDGPFQTPKGENRKNGSKTTMQAKMKKPEMAFHEQDGVRILQLARRWKPKEWTTQDGPVGKMQTQGPSSTVLVKDKLEDEMKKLRKELALYLVPMMRKAYLKQRWDKDCIPALKPFIEKCIFVSLIMNVHSPPMVFLELPPSDTKAPLSFDDAHYRTYTAKGTHMDYVVWPAMLLSKNGPLLLKGIAQGKK